MGRSVKIFAVLLPIAAFAWVVFAKVRVLMDAGKGLTSIVWMLGALAALAVVETALFKWWILPSIAQQVGERVYAGGSYMPSEDRLLVLVERIRAEKDRELLPLLEKCVLADARRARGWQEYAHVLHEVFADAPAALAVLRRGAQRARGKEDRAMLLCRAAHLAADAMRDSALASELYQEAAERYPRTAYGKFAAGKLA